MNRVSTKNLFTDNYTFPCVLENGNWNGWKTQAPMDCKPGSHCKDHSTNYPDLNPDQDCEMGFCNFPPDYVTCNLWYRGKTRTDKDGR